jgi:hypothetical protein
LYAEVEAILFRYDLVGINSRDEHAGRMVNAWLPDRSDPGPALIA